MHCWTKDPIVFDEGAESIREVVAQLCSHSQPMHPFGRTYIVGKGEARGQLMLEGKGEVAGESPLLLLGCIVQVPDKCHSWDPSFAREEA